MKIYGWFVRFKEEMFGLINYYDDISGFLFNVYYDGSLSFLSLVSSLLSGDNIILLNDDGSIIVGYYYFV